MNLNENDDNDYIKSKIDSDSSIFISIRESLYSRYESELGYLYSRSTFLWAFLTIMFTAYGYLLANFYFKKADGVVSYYVLDSAILVLSLIGIVFSMIWIAMAKASSAIEESYVIAIEAFESYPFDNVDFPTDWTLWTATKTVDADKKLYSKKEGGFSVKKLNTLIAQVVFCIWCGIYCIHTLHFQCLIMLEISLFAIACIVFSFACFLKKDCNSSWIGSPNKLSDAKKALLLIARALDELTKQKDKINTFKDYSEFYDRNIKCINFFLMGLFMERENNKKNKIISAYEEELLKFAQKRSNLTDYKPDLSGLTKALKDYEDFVTDKITDLIKKKRQDKKMN